MVAWQAQASKEPRDEHRTIHLHPSQTWGKIVLSPSQTWGQDHLDQMLFNIKQTFLTFCPTKYFLFIMAKFPDNWKVQSVLLFECLINIHFKLNFYLLAALCLTAACRTSTYRLNNWLCFELQPDMISAEPASLRILLKMLNLFVCLPETEKIVYQKVANRLRPHPTWTGIVLLSASSHPLRAQPLQARL